VVGPWDTLRSAAEKMAELKLSSFPVVDDNSTMVGILNIDDLLTARSKANLRDNDRKRVLTLRWPFGGSKVATRSIDVLVDRAMDSPALDQAEIRKTEETIESGLD
jgi:CBS-domain-containing membrane protein